MFVARAAMYVARAAMYVARAAMYVYVFVFVCIVASSAFIEQRRRDLKRFLVLVVRHPVLAKDEVVQYFLTAGGQVS